MSFRITCPECNTSNTVKDDFTGTKIRCRECDSSIRVPDDDGATDRDEPQPKKSGAGLITVLLVVGGSVAALGFICVVLVVVLFLVFRSPDTNKNEFADVGPPPFPGGLPPDMEDQLGPPPDQQHNPPPAQQDPDTLPPVGTPNPDAAPPQMESGTRDIVKQAAVYLRVTIGPGRGGEGSGFLACEPGIVITNAHVLGMMQPGSRPPSDIAVVIHSGEPGEKTLKGELVGFDRVNDLAIVRIPADGLPTPLPVDTAASLSETQELYVFGFPYGKSLGTNISIDKANVKSLHKFANGAIRQVVLTGDMQPGNSGGPVVDAAGRVVGVSVAGIKGTRINFAVPADCITAMVNGRLAERSYGDRVVEGNLIKLPVKLQLLNPLNRVSTVEFEVWAGKPGDDRPPPMSGTPDKRDGDGPRKLAKLPVDKEIVQGDITLPGVKPGQVHWVQPVLVSGSSRRYLTARALAAIDFPPNTMLADSREPEPRPTPEPKKSPEPRPGPEPKPGPAPKTNPEPKVEPTPKVDPKPPVDPKPGPEPKKEKQPKVEPNPKANVDPKIEPKREPELKPAPQPKPRPPGPVTLLNVNGQLTQNDFLGGPKARRTKTYEVKLEAGITYVIDMKQASKSSLNPFLQLKDPTDKVVAQDDDSGGRVDAKITYTPTVSGTFKVIATTTTGTPLGGFQLTVTSKE
jgi:hypothetical protein